MGQKQTFALRPPRQRLRPPSHFWEAPPAGLDVPEELGVPAFRGCGGTRLAVLALEDGRWQVAICAIQIEACARPAPHLEHLGQGNVLADSDEPTSPSRGWAFSGRRLAAQQQRQLAPFNAHDPIDVLREHKSPIPLFHRALPQMLAGFLLAAELVLPKATFVNATQPDRV